MQFTFRCKCGVLVITTDGNRFKCRSCEPRDITSPQEVYRQTRMLRPPRRVTKEKDDEDGKT